MKILFCLLILTSCAVPIKKKKSFSDQDFGLQNRFTYDSKQDRFPNILQNANDSLIVESIQRVSQNNLHRFDVEGDELLQSTAFCHMGKYKFGFDKLKQGFRKLKVNPNYWNQIGTCYLKVKEYEKAVLYYQTSLFAYEQAIGQKVIYGPAANNLGVMYAMQGDDAKAKVAFEAVLKQYPRSLTPRYNLAQIYLKYSITDKAIKHFEYLLSSDKNDPDVLAGLAMGYLIKNNVQSALKYYSQVPKQYKDRSYIGLGHAIATVMSGNISGGLKIFKATKRPVFYSNDMKNYYKDVQAYMDKKEKEWLAEQMRKRQSKKKSKK